MSRTTRIHRVAMIALAFLLVSCAATPGPEEAAAVRAVLEEQRKLWNAGELEEFVARGYWNSPQLNFLGDGSWNRGFDDALRRYRRKYGDGSAGMGDLDFTDIELVPVGVGHFLVRGRWALDYGGSEEQPNGLFSLIMRETSEGWRIIHDHTSSTPPLEAGTRKEPGS